MAITQEELDRVLGNKRKPSDNINYGSNYNPNPLSNVDILGSIGTQLRQMANNAYVNVPNTVRAIGAEASNDPFVKMFQPITPKPKQNYTVSQAPANYQSMSLGDQRIQDAASILLDPINAIPFAGTAAKGVVKGAKYLGKEALRQGYEGTGLLGKIAPDMKMYAYLPDTPSKPNALVGTRFVSKEQGNLVPEVQIPIEKIKGASLVGTPYDNTPADTLIEAVSDDIILQNPVYTMGGDNFSRIIGNYNNNIGGASNYGMASKMNNRFDVARQENLANKGTGEVYSTPFNMSDEVPSEAFSSYPTDIITQIFNQTGDKKSIAAFNDWFRNSGVQIQKNGKTVLVKPFTTFKGIETPEGLAQLYSGEGFSAGGTAGNARKNLFKGASQTKFEKMFGYNMKDIRGAVNVPEYANLPKGYARGNLIQIPENTILTPSSLGSKIKAYDTDTAGKYAATIKPSPVSVLMPKTYNRIYAEMKSKYPNYSDKSLLNMTVGAMEKRGDNISEIVDDQVIDSYYKYQEGLLGR